MWTVQTHTITFNQQYANICTTRCRLEYTNDLKAVGVVVGVAVGEEEEKVAICSCGSKYRAVGGFCEHVNATPVSPCLDTFTQIR
jgi:hypothetical protein